MKVYHYSKIDTDAPIHIESRACGLFVVGEGNCIKVNDMDEAKRIVNKVKELKKTD